MEEVNGTPLLILPVSPAGCRYGGYSEVHAEALGLPSCGVLLLFYAGMMATCLFIFLLLYPYALWMSHP